MVSTPMCNSIMEFRSSCKTFSKVLVKISSVYKLIIVHYKRRRVFVVNTTWNFIRQEFSKKVQRWLFEFLVKNFWIYCKLKISNKFHKKFFQNWFVEFLAKKFFKIYLCIAGVVFEPKIERVRERERSYLWKNLGMNIFKKE